VKTFKVNKNTESEPTMMGMAMVPFFSCLGALLLGIFVVLATRTFLSALLSLVLFTLTIFGSNYIYNNKVFDRISDAQHPKSIHNDIF
tara:strand:+ start:264 stop:527 length:264 start_codon:yes stop_codon:yes gene_type:complete